MNDLRKLKWSNGDKQIARQAFNKAYEGECAEILTKVRQMADKTQEPGDLWRIHDFLDARRRAIHEKYDYRYSVLIQVFSRLVHEGRLALDDLDGLDEDKLSRIEGLVQSMREWDQRGR